MPADLVHLVRHGEVHNPDGRALRPHLEGFGLSDLGHRMAAAAADGLAGHPVPRSIASPLQRTQESAQRRGPTRFGLDITTDERADRAAPTGSRASACARRSAAPTHWPRLRTRACPAGVSPSLSVARAHARRDHGRARRRRRGRGRHGEPPDADRRWSHRARRRSARCTTTRAQRRCSLSSITTLRRGRATASSRSAYQEPAQTCSRQPPISVPCERSS